MTEQEISALLQQAVLARQQAYVPYSHFAVGAALLCADGSVVQGCNIENVSYGLTNCAERTAIFTAIAQGKRQFAAMAVVADSPEPVAPCGACRQVMVEFQVPQIIMGNLAGQRLVMSLAELMPYGFSAFTSDRS